MEKVVVVGPPPFSFVRCFLDAIPTLDGEVLLVWIEKGGIRPVCVCVSVYVVE